MTGASFDVAVPAPGLRFSRPPIHGDGSEPKEADQLAVRITR
jgi:hypothetical protein